MKRLISVLLAVMVAGVSYAQTPTPNPVDVNRLVGLHFSPAQAEAIVALGSLLANTEYVQFANQAGSGIIDALTVNGTDDTELNADTGDLIHLAVAKTPIAIMGVSGFTTLPIAGNASVAADKSFVFAASVPTMASTPIAGTNDFKLGLNVIPTAAANTAALLPTPVAANVSASMINSGPNAVRVKAGGTNTINGSAAGAYIPLATMARVDCFAESATNWRCGSAVVPTPAGP